MKGLVVFLVLGFSVVLLAEDAVVPVPTVAAAAEAVQALPDVAPDAKFLPPTWLAKAMDVVSSMPVVGPIVVEVAKWLGVIASILTILVTALLGVLRVLITSANLLKLASLAAKIEALMNGPLMYWLKFFSVYNAKKKDGQVSAKPDAAT